MLTDHEMKIKEHRTGKQTCGQTDKQMIIQTNNFTNSKQIIIKTGRHDYTNKQTILKTGRHDYTNRQMILKTANK